MFRPATKIAAVSALALLVGACTGPTADVGNPAPSPTPSSPTPASAPPTTAKRAYTAQGFIAKNLGELSGLGCTTSIETCSIKFAVDKIEVNPKCHQYGTPPRGGRKTLLLHVSLTTGTMASDVAAHAPTLFAPFSLKALSPDGFVHESLAGSCSDHTTALSHTILPNSRYAGTVEIEVPESATSVASAHEPAQDGNRGWVWPIA